MTREEVVYEVLRKRWFGWMQFDIDRHTSGEPVEIFGSELRPLSKEIIRALDVRD